jgi:hypothetical protein
VVALFASAIFVAAGLVFLVQPMIAKALLPQFGGAPQVWTAATVFFQVALLVGYGYAHFATSRLGARRGPIVHLALLALPLLALPITLRGTELAAGASPALGVLAILTLSVGAPYVAVSATSPLLQRWFSTTGRAGSGDPYFLYAAGNAGSLLGLLAYPLLVEPRLAVGEQALLWSAGYVVFAILVVATAVAASRRGPADDLPEPIVQATTTEPSRLGLRRQARWVVLAFIPSSLLLGVTTHLQTDIAAVPLLWAIPLAIYLLTFVLAFARRPRMPPRTAARLLAPLVVGVVLTILFPAVLPTPLAMALHYGTFFIAAMLAHGRLAADRPNPRHLTRFYLLVAVGGALGGTFNAIVAPLVFDQVLEYPILLVAALLLRPGWTPEDRRGTIVDLVAALGTYLVALSAVLAMQRLARDVPSAVVVGVFTIGALLLARRPMRFGLAVAALLSISFVGGRAPAFADRTFFGVHRVLAEGDRNVYLNGLTVHGSQLTGAGGGRTALAYYHATGPAGQVFEMLEGRLTPVRDVGIIGLGAGSLAAYGGSGQTFTFYEIDPVVIRIASDERLFTFVRDSEATVDLVEGDGRLRIAEADDASFDVLVLDAFSSDAVPAHLVTRQAFELYVRKLRPGGLLLANVTNSYLDVKAVVAGGAQAVGLAGLFQDDVDLSVAPPGHKEASSWVLLARTEGDLAGLVADSRWKPIRGIDPTIVWTDEFSDILSVVRR